MPQDASGLRAPNSNQKKHQQKYQSVSGFNACIPKSCPDSTVISARVYWRRKTDPENSLSGH
jgi:hypothetical protein